jgi:hypothetical protein
MTAIVRKSDILTSIRVALPSERGESCVVVAEAYWPGGAGGEWFESLTHLSSISLKYFTKVVDK